MKAKAKQVRSYPFVPETKSDKAPDIFKEQTPRQFLEEHYVKGCIFGLHELQRNGVYKLMGWAYDFQDFMKRFIVRQHDNWSVYYAPSVRLLRRSTYGKLDEVHEIPKL